MSTKEQWKLCHHGLYEISTIGRVRHICPRQGTSMNRIRKLRVNNVGYYHVILNNFGQRKVYSIHRMVAKAFIADYSEDLEVNHIDGDKLNNSVDNLEMVTHRENMRHASATGLMPRSITAAMILQVKTMRSNGVKYNDIAATVGASVHSCQNIINEKGAYVQRKEGI